MEVKIKYPEAQERHYPYLGVTESGRVVLFSERRTGVLLRDTTETLKVGFFTDTWAECEFSILNGVVTMENN